MSSIHGVFDLSVPTHSQHLYFVVLLAGLLAMLLAYDGYLGVYILPNLVALKPFYIPLSFSLLIASIILFSDAFLESRTRLPKLHWSNVLFAAGWGVLMLLTPFVSYHNTGIEAGMPAIACIALGVVGPTACKFLIDLTAGMSVKQFIRSEWYGGTAVLAATVYLICDQYLKLSIWPATLISFGVGFVFRVTALWFTWEEPMTRSISAHVLGKNNRRVTLKEKMVPG